MNEVTDFLCAVLPSVETWLRGVIKSEVQKAFEDEQAKKRPPKTYTRQEVAKMAHISLPTLWKHVEQGKIKPMPKTGRRVLFSEDEVKRYLKGGIV